MLTATRPIQNNTMSTSNWADQERELPAPQVIDNNDGTKTIISYRLNDQKKKVKVTQKIKFVKTTKTVNPAVAKRSHWKRFGIERDNKTVGPDTKTTQIMEGVKLILSTTWKADEEKEQQEAAKARVGKSAFVCRICGGRHLTAHCPYKDQFGFGKGDVPGISSPAGAANTSLKSASSSGPSKYVLPHLRNGANGGAGATAPVPTEVPALRITNLNSAIDRDALQSIVSRFGNYDRVSILKNRETGEPLGVAFVNMTTLKGAEAVKENLDGKGLMNMIISVDWARPK